MLPPLGAAAVLRSALHIGIACPGVGIFRRGYSFAHSLLLGGLRRCRSCRRRCISVGGLGVVDSLCRCRRLGARGPGLRLGLSRRRDHRAEGLRAGQVLHALGRNSCCSFNDRRFRTPFIFGGVGPLFGRYGMHDVAGDETAAKTNGDGRDDRSGANEIGCRSAH